MTTLFLVTRAHRHLLDRVVVPAALGLLDHQIVLLETIFALVPIVVGAPFRASPIGLVWETHGRGLSGAKRPQCMETLELDRQRPTAHEAAGARASAGSGS